MYPGARPLAAVKHPHIVSVYTFGERDGEAYLVMEYVAGRSLSQRIKDEGPLPLPEALRLTLQIVDELDAAWQAGIVHRDVKPW